MKTSGASHLKNVVLPKQMVCAEATCGTQRQSKVGIRSISRLHMILGVSTNIWYKPEVLWEDMVPTTKTWRSPESHGCGSHAQGSTP